MEVFAGAVLNLIIAVLNIYIYVIIAEVILSWLIAFDIVNPRNRVVHIIRSVTYTLTEPLLRPIRSLLYRVLPSMGGIDLSPLALLLIIYFVMDLLSGLYVRYAVAT